MSSWSDSRSGRSSAWGAAASELARVGRRSSSGGTSANVGASVADSRASAASRSRRSPRASSSWATRWPTRRRSAGVTSSASRSRSWRVRRRSRSTISPSSSLARSLAGAAGSGSAAASRQARQYPARPGPNSRSQPVQSPARPSGARPKIREHHLFAVGRQGNRVRCELPGGPVLPRRLHLVDSVEQSPPAKWAIYG
jgi:hypothetical protein